MINKQMSETRRETLTGHQTLTYYGKEIVIPNINDFVTVHGICDTIIIIVDKVVKGSGKKGLYFSGYTQESINNPGIITFIDRQSRNNFQATNKRLTVYPKVKNGAVMRYYILDI